MISKTSFAVCCCYTKVCGTHLSSVSKYHGLQLNAMGGSSFAVHVHIHLPHWLLINASLAKQVSQEEWEPTAQYCINVPKRVCPNVKIQGVAMRVKITRTTKQLQNTTGAIKAGALTWSCRCCWLSHCTCLLLIMFTDCACNRNACLSTDSRQCYFSAGKTPRISVQQSAAPSAYAVSDLNDEFPEKGTLESLLSAQHYWHVCYAAYS